jgi:hypothetical protein
MRGSGRALAFGIVLVWAGLVGAFNDAGGGPKPGVWVIADAVDKNGVAWAGKMVLKQTGKLTYRGHVDWRTTDGANVGREMVEAIYAPATKTLTIAGKSVKVKKGKVEATTYTAKVSEDGAKLTRGRWAPAGGIASGRWKATWKRD